MKTFLGLALATLLVVPRLDAQTTATITSPYSYGAFPWGPGGPYAYGQSFTVPTNASILDSFTFTSLNQGGVGGFDYKTYLYAFNPSLGTSPGSALFTSSLQVLPNSGAVADMITPNLHLTPGAHYIVFVSAAGLDQTLNSNPYASGATAFLGAYAGQSYSGGDLYFASTYNLNSVADYSWQDYTIDSAFTAIFSVASTIFASTPGLNGNQRGIASSIDGASTGSSAAIFNLTNALSSLPVTSIAGALDQLSPTKFATFASTTAINNEVFATQDMDIYLQSLRDDSTGGFAGGSGKLDSSGLVVNDPNVDPGLQMIHSRMLAWEDPLNTITDVPGSILGGVDMKDVKQVKTSAASEQPWDVFLRGNVILAQGFSQADVPHFDDNSESVVVGADYHFTPHLLAGVTASYAHTDATLDDFGSSATVDSYSPGVFVSWADGGGYVNFLGRYSYNSYTESRDIAFLGQSANGATDGNEGVVDLDGGYDFHSGPWTYGPVAGLQYTHLTVNGYTEGGSDAALSVNEDQSDSLRSRLGGSVRYSLNGCGVKFTPRLEATWQHEFLSQDRGLTSQFEDFGGGSFTVRTPNASDDSALVDVGLDAQVNQTITVFGDYLVQAGQSNYFGQSIQAGVRVNF